LARSLLVSVFPVPAGPSGAPPRFNFNAPISVLKTVSFIVYITTILQPKLSLKQYKFAFLKSLIETEMTMSLTPKFFLITFFQFAVYDILTPYATAFSIDNSFVINAGYNYRLFA